MKKTILSILLFCGAYLMVPAQENRHELALGYGTGTTDELIGIFSDILVTGITQGAYVSRNNSYTGAFHLGYKYGISERFWLGGAIAYENAGSDAFVGNRKEGRFTSNFYTLAAEARYHYLNRGRFAFYGLLGAGATLYSQEFKPEESGAKDSSSVVHFNFQLSPLGIRYGGRVGGFAEAGFGYRGILFAGVFARF